jgi:hypothetical protein
MSEEKKHSVTLITDLEMLTNEENSFILEEKEDVLKDVIIDLSTSLGNRIKALDLFYSKYGEEKSLELINRLTTMYTFSGTVVLRAYVYEICVNSHISPFLKIMCAKSLCYFDSKKEIGYKALDYVCKVMKSDVATPCQIDAVCVLMKHKKFKTKAREYFVAIINNLDLDCDYRYKAILSLENKEIHNSSYFIKEALYEFFQNKKNMTMYRILCGQYILNMKEYKLLVRERKNIEFTLMTFAQDPDLDYNLRADSADVLLRLGSNENKKTSREIIMMLGREGNGENKTIFDNAQNVHVDEIEESVIEVLEYLSSIEMKPITFEYVKKQIEDILKKDEPPKPNKGDEKSDTLIEHEKRVDNIFIALNRIYVDRALYSKYNCTLMNILLKIWVYLSSHKSKDEMIKRLLQELYEMSGTCSTGFASRLINVISGFGKFNLRISWRDQITANFTGRLNFRARNITDPKTTQKNYNIYCKRKIQQNDEKEISYEKELEYFQEKVLNEMTINTNDFESRKHFLKFFRKNMLSIREELYEEFKEHITDADFDLYLRSAISTYETGGYV